MNLFSSLDRKCSSYSFITLLLLFILLTSGCATPSIYYWGEYENLIYSQYSNPGKATPEYQIEKLELDIQKAKSQNKPMPPGFYGHLGYQYLQAGKASEAKSCFQTEMSMFPESAFLMNRFLKKMK